MTLTTADPHPKFKAKRAHYMALALGGLLILEHQYVVPILLVIFLLLCYFREKKFHDYGRSASYWEFQAQSMWNKVILTRYELILWRHSKLERERLEKRKKIQEERKCRGRIMEEAKHVGQLDPLDLATEKIWVKILEHLDDPQDVVSCYYTCNLFHSLLEVEVKAKAFAVLDNYLEKHTSDGGLEHEDILNCRLVCTNWKLSVDYFLQHSPVQMKFQGHCYPCTVIDSYDSRHVEGLIQRLISNYHHSNSNPIPSRHLQLNIRHDVSEGDRKIFQEAVSILLKYFGKHVWYISITANVEQNEVETYRQVYGFLRQTGNAKMVEISLRGVPKDQHSPTERADLEAFLLYHEFPKLRSMKALKFDGCPDGIINSALRSNEHLERLEVRCTDSAHGWINNQGNYPDLPGLRYCTLSNIRVPQMTELQKVNWPLAELTVEPGEGQRDPMDLSKMCATFQHFSKSLRSLNFGTKWRSMANQRLALPKVEELEVHFEGKVLMDFMLPMDSLQVLKVNLYNEQRYNDVHELEIIKFKDAVKTLHKQDTTNIWRLFPELKEVTVTLIKQVGERRRERSYIYYRQGEEITKMVKND